MKTISAQCLKQCASEPPISLTHIKFILNSRVDIVHNSKKRVNHPLAQGHRLDLLDAPGDVPAGIAIKEVKMKTTPRESSQRNTIATAVQSNNQALAEKQLNSSFEFSRSDNSC